MQGKEEKHLETSLSKQMGKLLSEQTTREFFLFVFVLNKERIKDILQQTEGQRVINRVLGTTQTHRGVAK